MIRPVQAFLDGAGKLHATRDEAIQANVYDNLLDRFPDTDHNTLRILSRAWADVQLLIKTSTTETLGSPNVSSDN